MLLLFIKVIFDDLLLNLLGVLLAVIVHGLLPCLDVIAMLLIGVELKQLDGFLGDLFGVFASEYTHGGIHLSDVLAVVGIVEDGLEERFRYDSLS